MHPRLGGRDRVVNRSSSGSAGRLLMVGLGHWSCWQHAVGGYGVLSPNVRDCNDDGSGNARRSSGCKNTTCVRIRVCGCQGHVPTWCGDRVVRHPDRRIATGASLKPVWAKHRNNDRIFARQRPIISAGIAMVSAQDQRPEEFKTPIIHATR